MRRACSEVLVESRRDGVGIAVCDERVDQSVTAAVADFLVRVAEPVQIVGVVAQMQVGIVHRWPTDRACLLRIGLEHHLVLGSENLVRSHCFSGFTGVFGSGQIGVCACGTARGQREHLGAERGEDPTLHRDSGLVEVVEVAHQCVVRLPVFLGGLGVTGTDAQDEPSGVLALDAVIRRGDVGGCIGPDVDDAGGDDDGVRGVEDLLGGRQVRGRGSAEPDGPVAEGLDGAGQLRRERRVQSPDAVLAEFRCGSHVRSQRSSLSKIPGILIRPVR